MPFLQHDERFLHRALALAEAQAAFASPNPAVGCVLTQGEIIVGEGAHRFDLRDHAEIAALKQAATLGHDVRGATAYVTLEPCSHQGRTGPCADALVVAGVTRCVVATVDPNPQVRGKGLAILRRAGVDVVLADLASTITGGARRLNDAFAYAIQNARPFITLKSALSADGKLAPPAAARTAIAPHWLTGEAARADVQQLRHASDAVLTGIGTVLADDPSLTDRSGLPRRRPLLRIVLDSDLRLPLDSKLVDSSKGDLLVVTSGRGPQKKQRALEERGIDVVPLSFANSKADLNALFHSVLERRLLRSVLVEAGSTLNGALLENGLVDRLVLYKSTLTLGPDALPFAIGQGDPTSWEEKLSAVSRRKFTHGHGHDLRFTGYLHDPWNGVDAANANLQIKTEILMAKDKQRTSP